MPDMPAGPHSVIFIGSVSGYQTTVPLNLISSLNLLNGTSGKVGAIAMVQLRGFGASESVNVQWVPPGGQPATMGAVTTSATGAAYTSFTVPEAAAGDYTVQAVGTTSGATSSATYTVIPSVALTIGTGKPAQATTANVRGFASGESVELRWYDTPTSYTVVGNAVTSALGSATIAFVTPQGANGPHTVEAAGSTGNLASTTYAVQPNLALTPTTGPAGTTITLALSGYKPGDAVAVRWYDTTTTLVQVASVTPGPDGSAQASFVAPEGVNGFHKIDALSATNLSAYVNFLTTAGMSMDPTSGSVGDSVTVGFNGYKAGETVNLRWYPNAYSTVTVGSAVASATGSGSITFAIPDATAGSYKVELLGATTGARVSQMFTVNSNGGQPPVPACSINPSDVEPGASMAVSCSAFSPQEFVRIYLDSTSTTQRGMLLTNLTGSGSTTIYVPDLPAGPHTMFFVGANSGYQTSVPMNIVPTLKLVNGTSGKVGALAIVQLRGYGANETVNIQWAPAGGSPVTVGTATTSATGTASPYFSIPEAAAGVYTVQVVGTTSGATGSATYTVVPSLALTITIGKPAQAASATLRGYAAGESVELRWYDTPTSYTVIGNAVASALGSATIAFIAPQGANGAHTVEAAGSTGNVASATFTVQPNLVLTPTTGPAGTTTSLTLSGYRPGEVVTVRWYDTATSPVQVTTVIPAADGSAQVSINTPEGVNGFHKIDAVSSTGLNAYVNFLTTAGMSMTSTVGQRGDERDGHLYRLQGR